MEIDASRFTIAFVVAAVALIGAGLATDVSARCLNVKHVIDGDTIIAADCNSGAEVRVRLANLSAPEVDEPGGAEATQHISSMLKHADLIVLDWHGEESYGRLVGDLYVRRSNSMVHINEEMRRYFANDVAQEANDLSDQSPTHNASQEQRVSDPSCSSTETGWVTVGPCYQGSAGYEASYDRDNDGVACEQGCRFYRPRTQVTTPASESASQPSASRSRSSSTARGAWVTIGPCSRGQSCYSPIGDGDNDGTSCERGCRIWRSR